MKQKARKAIMVGSDNHAEIVHFNQWILGIVEKYIKIKKKKKTQHDSQLWS